jgi:hypothetical protein
MSGNFGYRNYSHEIDVGLLGCKDLGPEHGDSIFL